MIRRVAIAAAAMAAIAGAAPAQVTDYRDIKTPALRKLNTPQPKRIQLDNGMVIFLMEDHELPLIRGVAHIRGGSREEPADKTGLTAILGSAWRTGGTEKQTGDQLDEFLESRAARVETGADDDSMSVRFDILKGDLEAVLPIYVDLLRNPAFRQEKIDLAKTQLNTGISRRNDEPGGILGRELDRLGYGPNSAYGRIPEYSTVSAVTRDDLLAFHKKFVHPNNIIFGVVGDFDTAKMEARLRQAFGGWAKGPQAPKPVFEPAPAKPGVYFVSKPDVTQANIGLVQPGIRRDNPDYYALAVMNEILSGGFSGRLMNKLRSQRGLTYGVGGGMEAPYDHPGLFTVSMATKSTTTVEALTALRDEIRLLTTSPFTGEELSLAKESILNAFIFTLDSRSKVLNQAVLLEFYGYPPDYFQKYPGFIEKVTADDVARVAKKYVTPDQLAFLVVGNEKDFDKPLASFGTVTPLDVTIPEPGAKKPAAGAAAPASTSSSAASNAEGLALVKKMIEFAGGKAALDNLKSVHMVQALSTKGPQGMMDIEADSWTVFPDRKRNVMKTPMGEITQISTPEAAFMIVPGMGTRDIPSSQRDAARARDKQEIIYVLKYPEQYTFAAGGTEKVGTVDARVLEVTSGTDSFRFLVDPATGRVLRRIARASAPMEGETVTEYGDYKSFGGITIATTASMTLNGEPVMSGTVKSAEVNPTVDPKVFEKPAS